MKIGLKFGSLCFCILASGCGTLTNSHTEKMPDPELAPGERLITYTRPNPFSYDFYVMGIVNGEKRQFRLDTGSYISSLKLDEKTKLLKSERLMKDGGAATVSFECDLVKLDSFHAASITRNGMEVERCANLAYNNLGIDMLYHQIVELNFQNSSFTVVSKVPAGAKLSPLKRSAIGHLILPYAIDGITGDAVFDTGAELNMIDEKVVQANPTLFTPASSEPTEMIDIAGNKVNSRLFVIEHFRIGSLDFGRQLVGSMPFPAMLSEALAHASFIIGSGTMVFANWIFDLKNNLWFAYLRKE